jgi:hypothetical protein
VPRQLLATVLAALGFLGFAGAAHAQKPAAPRAKAAATATLDVTVTNGTGTPLEGIGVSVSGPVTRQATTNAEGAVRLQGLKAGTYRLRFDGEGWISLEREAVVAARSGSLDVHVMLTEAPPPPPPPPPPDPPAREPEVERPVGEAKVTNVADFADRNLIRGNEPQRLNVFGCTGYATTRLLQIRDPLDKRVLDEADETIYVLAGEGVLTIDGKPQGLKPGVLAVIPRGTDSSIARRSRGPLIAVSVVSGPPCTANEK